MTSCRGGRKDGQGNNPPNVYIYCEANEVNRKLAHLRLRSTMVGLPPSPRHHCNGICIAEKIYGIQIEIVTLTMNHNVAAARLATMAVLFCNGLLYATWGVSVPVIKDKFGMSEGMLSLAMAAVAIGGITTMAAAGRWIARVGSGRASIHSGLLMAVAAAPILLLSHYGTLLALLFTYGIMTAANDVAANAQAAHLEKLSGRSLIGSVHGSFSVGGLVGALTAGAWASFSLPAATSYLVMAPVVVVAMLCASRFLHNEPRQQTTLQTTLRSGRDADPALNGQVRWRLRIFGMLAFAALIIEGAFYDWAAVYMKEIARAPASWVGLGYAAFAITMAVGRLGGDWIRDHYSHQVVIGGSGIISVAGLAVVVANVSPTLVVLGFLITGIGLSNVIPVLFSSAGKLSVQAGVSASQGLAVTTRIAYVGLLVGPLLIGPLAELAGLRLSMQSLVAAIVVTCSGWLLLSRSSGGTPWVVDHISNG